MQQINKTINSVLTNMRSASLQKPDATAVCRDSTGRETVSLPQTSWTSRWKSPADVERSFSPQHWAYAAAHITRAYTAPCPTLQQYADCFGMEYAADWVQIQMLALYGSSSNQSKGVADGIPLFSSSFAAEAGRYKLSELMLFFARYKAGRYDKSFSSFDCRRIGNSFFREFLPDRADELYRIELGRQQSLRLDNERRYKSVNESEIPEGYTSYTWFLKCKREEIERNGGKPTGGFFDDEAMRMKL